MSKPDDIPQDVWDRAWDAHDLLVTMKSANIETIARAILSERTKAAEIADSYASNWDVADPDIAEEIRSDISQAIRKGGKE